jgi:hypothetical protein
MFKSVYLLIILVGWFSHAFMLLRETRLQRSHFPQLTTFFTNPVALIYSIRRKREVMRG